METIDYLLPDWAAPYLVNNDCSHMSESEIAMVDAFVDKHNIRIVGIQDDSHFCTQNDLTKLGDQCSTFLAVKNEPVKTVIPEWLFIITYPNAYVYADKRKETAGDYHTIVHLYFKPLEFKVFDDSPKYAEAIKIAQQEYNTILANLERRIQVSATKQTVKARKKNI